MRPYQGCLGGMKLIVSLMSLGAYPTRSMMHSFASVEMGNGTLMSLSFRIPVTVETK